MRFAPNAGGSLPSLWRLSSVRILGFAHLVSDDHRAVGGVDSTIMIPFVWCQSNGTLEFWFAFIKRVI